MNPRVVDDFLPAPEEFVFEEDNVNDPGQIKRGSLQGGGEKTSRLLPNYDP